VSDREWRGLPVHTLTRRDALQGLPTTMIYDREGILRKKVIGFDYVESFEEAVKPLL
jgi:hypothetical protein